ncbi:Nucleoside/nucleotide kinase [Spironucleus salmonicida]|uniref:Nucleoside/nucleotide kinase n=1 Tax=Spironucleus salmonicida TaxID=348837 RepID=V6LA69_9EUKA|nr:Nucleoside/nucleotide kinase [Spironucleus salmonicida]|eukprot:EST41315.1 hypothetical protein SS50377_19027 [Spironucleus salmonicida]
MNVICLEGCHGVGKSTICEHLIEQGEIVLDEMFIDMPHYDIIHSQSLTMEFIWVANWFNRLLRLYEQHKGKTIYADRSPYCALYYSKCTESEQAAFKQLIYSQIQEMSKVGIKITTVNISVDSEILWVRIQDRLAKEPFRRNFSEDSRDWMDKTYKWYQSFTWDFNIDNTSNDGYKSILSTVIADVKQVK